MFNIGERLKRLLELNSLSANKLSKDINVDPSTISKIINEISLPSFELLDKICKYLDITFKEFFDDETQYKGLEDIEFYKLVEQCKSLTEEQIRSLLNLISAFRNN